MSDTLRRGGITLRRRDDATGSAMDATWVAEAAGEGAVGELGTKLLVPNARRMGVELTPRLGTARGALVDPLRLLVDHLFETFACHRLDLNACDTQADVINAALECGFVGEGRCRHAHVLDGRWHDRIHVGLREEEWRGGIWPIGVPFMPAAGRPVAAALPVIPSPAPEDFAVLRGQLVRLRRKRPSDKALCYRWQCRPEWWRLWMPENPDGFRPPSPQEFDATWDDRPSPNEWIVETEDGVPLGVCFYCSMDRPSRSTEAAFLLYEAEHWGRGYGTDALAVLLRHLFCDLTLHRVSSGTWSGNIGSCRVQEKNGLQVEVRSRDAYLVDGEWYDGLGTGILEDEFETRC